MRSPLDMYNDHVKRDLLTIGFKFDDLSAIQQIHAGTVIASYYKKGRSAMDAAAKLHKAIIKGSKQ